MNNNNGTIVYIGGFELPDKNAAAQRVIGVAKIFKKLNYRVVLIGTDKMKKGNQISDGKILYDGFECYSEKYPQNLALWVHHVCDASRYIELINKLEDVRIVVFYNFQSIAMAKIMRYCKKNSIKCIADATEWYQPGGNIFRKIIKKLDTDLRMKKLHFKCDGVIAISKYLYDFYKVSVTSIKLPPTVDIDDNKWRLFANSEKKYTFVYAGKATDRKERLDIIINAIENNPMASLCVVGMTKQEYEQMYNDSITGKNILFKGRVTHKEAIEIVKQSEWSVIVRNRTRVNEAGFPTKVVESISCGVPVCANEFSNIDEYLNNENSILCENINDINRVIDNALHSHKLSFDRSVFDYRHYIDAMNIFLNDIYK